jgi:hypothetical protein
VPLALHRHVTRALNVALRLSSAVYNAAVQELKGDSQPFLNFTFFDALNATVAARAYLDDSSSFLLEEAAAVEAAGDATIAHLWKMAGGLIRLVVQVA